MTKLTLEESEFKISKEYPGSENLTPASGYVYKGIAQWLREMTK